MANTLITDDVITTRMLAKLRNNLVLYEKCDQQFSSDFTNKVGDTINIRRRVRFVSNSGADITSQIQDVVEGKIAVQLDQRKNVAFQFSSQERTLDIEEFDARYIDPAVTELSQVVETHIASQYTKIFHFLGTPGTGPSTLLHVGGMRTLLTKHGVPQMEEVSAFFDPDAALNIADGVKAVFPQQIAKTAIEEAMIARMGKMGIYECASLALHTVGVATGTPLVNGADQNVTYSGAQANSYTQSLITDGWTNDQTDILKAGDVITIAGVNSVNPRTRADTGDLQTFTVTADVDSGATTGPATLTISPPIITSGAYQTVTAAPADDAVITVKSGTGGTSHVQNMAFAKNAITVAFANLDAPDGGAEYSQKRDGNISIRMVKDYNILTDQNICRFDILFAAEVQNPFMAVRRTS